MARIRARTWLLGFAGLVAIALACLWYIQAQANFVPSFVAAFGLKHMIDEPDSASQCTWRYFSGQADFRKVREAAIAEFSSRGYEVEEGKGGVILILSMNRKKAGLIPDHKYTAKGELHSAKGWVALWLIHSDSWWQRLGDRLGFET